MAETFIYDYSFDRPDPAAMKASGAAGVARYLAPLPNSKVLSRAELDRLIGVGLSVTVIWETVNQRALKSGYAGGMNDAHEAIAMAQGLGFPDGTGLYYCLEDPTKLSRNDWPPVIDYARGVYDAGGPFRRGGYGSQALLEEVIHLGFIELGWQVEGWSSGVSPVCHLYQRSNTRNHPFAGTDENVCLQPDWGQYPLVTKPAPTPPGDDDDMPAKLYALPFDGPDAQRLAAKDRGLVAAVPSNGGRPWWIPSNDALALERQMGAVTGEPVVLLGAQAQAALLALVAWSR